MPRSIPFLFALLILSSCKSQVEIDTSFEDFLELEGNQFKVLIQNGTIINGLDTIQRKQDLLINGDTIAYLGKVDTSKVEIDLIIDASHQIIAPGFIDAHAHGDPLSTPEFENFLRMGVTTICLGQDGSSPKINNLDSWISKVNAIRPGVNIALFIGHGTLRQLSGVNYKSDPNKNDIQKMNILLEKGLQAGCFGMSTGLEYVPGIYATEAELSSLAQTIGAYDGMIMSHIRNEDDDALEASIQELLDLGKFCRVQVSHLKSVYGKGSERAVEILELFDSPVKATADFYPYNASYTGIGIVFPKWAKAPNNYKIVSQKRRKELLEFLKNKVEQRNGPEATLFGTGYFAGRTLKELSDEAGRPYEEILLDIGPNGASGAYMVMDEQLQERLFQDEHVMVGSDGSPTMRHPRGYGTFAKIIETYVLEKGLVSLPTAIYKMTGFPAKTIGFPDRGSIMEGQKADIVIFDPNKVKAKATFVNPKQPAVGFEWVMINGNLVIENGILKEERYGEVLRKKP